MLINQKTPVLVPVPVLIPVPEDSKPATEQEPVLIKPVETGVLDELFVFKPDDIIKGFVFSQILAEPRSRQRGGNPWRSKY